MTMLSNQQIERYSRQIIVEGVGGVAQERLLGSHVALIGSTTDVELALRYLTGAGIGAIHLRIDDRASCARLIGDVRAANSEVKVSDTIPHDLDLVFALIGSAKALRLVEACARDHRDVPTVWVRLDTLQRIAILRDPSTCYQCANLSLIAPFRVRGEDAGSVTMVATTEAMKLLIGYQTQGSRLIEFDGYASRSTPIVGDTSRDCACHQASQ